MTFSNVLVTGGAGFLGSMLLQELLPISSHIYVLDDLSTGNPDAIPKSDKITFYQDSITNEKILEEILPNVEWIFHLACRNILLAALDLDEDFHNNLLGGYTLLKKAQSHCPRLKKFLYTSTASVYGNAAILPTPESYHQVTMPYSASKFSVEHYCQVFYHMHQMPITTLRLSNVYGPGQLESNPYCGVVAKIFDAIRKGQPIPVYGDGYQTRDFTFIEDAIEAIIVAAQDPDTVGRVYNVGTGKETNINQLAAVIASIAGKESHPIEYLPKRIIDKVNRRAMNTSLIQSELKWAPRHSLEEGLAKTYIWLTEKGKQAT